MIRTESTRHGSKISSSCSFYRKIALNERMTFLSSLRNIDATILQQSNAKLTHGLLSDVASSDENKNNFISETTTAYLVVTE